MITLDQITFAYPHRPLLFQDFSWQAQQGQSWAVLGPSGSGKTTLLYLLSGLRLPSEGQVQVSGAPLYRPRPQTGLILQDYGLLPWSTVLDNIRLGLRIRRFYGPDGKHAPPSPLPPFPLGKGPGVRSLPPSTGAPSDPATRWLNRLGLSDLAGQYPGQLSGGQRQRVAIARTLALQPDLLLMDEPFSSLDSATRQDLRNLTLELWREQGFTFIVVTHSIEEAAHLGQFILLLGSPPHRRPEIIANPCFSHPAQTPGPDLEDSALYRALVRDLRARLAASAPPLRTEAL